MPSENTLAVEVLEVQVVQAQKNQVEAVRKQPVDTKEVIIKKKGARYESRR